QAVQVGDEYDKAHQNTHRKSMSNAHSEAVSWDFRPVPPATWQILVAVRDRHARRDPIAGSHVTWRILGPWRTLPRV
ncbi:hypothetical protein ACSDR0_40280, partial [Streptosporangium sp. G11]|uniref:hypothetical protein n=1 Tax=Streptosporangium sp. G11 TaxID=3436926 RepID=UPI003EBC6234